MNIEEIISYALPAPSGDNTQPWRFRIRRDSISIYNEPLADQSLYNFEQGAAYVSQGALIENISIAASHQGALAKVTLFPNSGEQNLVAVIDFEETDQPADPLYTFIPLRHTNRKPYDSKALSPEEITQLNNITGNNPAFRFVVDPSEIKKLAYAASRNEQLVLGNEFLHKFLFDHVRWNEAHLSKHKNGLYLKTLEMNGFQEMIFKLASKWSRVKVLNKLGLANKVASENEQIYASSGGFGAIIVPVATPEGFIQTGRLVQRIWLEATRIGLNIHPLTGIVFLKNRLRKSQEHFNPQEIATIDEAYKIIQNCFGASDSDRITFQFRIGHALPPSAISPRLTLNQLLKA